jgi:DNA adenine methylase
MRVVEKVLLEPNQEESEKDYLSRFMDDAGSMQEFPDKKQRYAVGYRIWESQQEKVEKRLALWGSTAGKSRVAKRVVPMIPEHETYVEPFAGGAAIFYAKPKDVSKLEVLSDTHTEVAFSFKYLRDATDNDFSRVRAQEWTVSKDIARKVHDLKPSKGEERFYRFAYKRYAMFFRNENRITAIDPAKAGKKPTLINNLEKTRDRLKGVKVHNDSYEKVVQAYDAPDTFFYLDPPYPRIAQEVGESEFDEGAFIKCLEKMKGKFLLHYDYRDKSKFLNKGWNVKVITVVKTGGGTVGSLAGKLLEVTNYKAPVAKSEKGPAFSITMPIIKKDDDEKIVTGIVLEPDEVDAQGDTVSKEAIQEAAHKFLSKFNKDTELGFMHKGFGDLGMSLIESWVARDNCEIGGSPVKSGSWLMSVKVDNNESLWKKIKSGDISGFSIGGVARVSR